MKAVAAAEEEGISIEETLPSEPAPDGSVQKPVPGARPVIPGLLVGALLVLAIVLIWWSPWKGEPPGEVATVPDVRSGPLAEPAGHEPLLPEPTEAIDPPPTGVEIGHIPEGDGESAAGGPDSEAPKLIIDKIPDDDDPSDGP